jgi:hypothetical protein
MSALAAGHDDLEVPLFVSRAGGVAVVATAETARG